MNHIKVGQHIYALLAELKSEHQAETAYQVLAHFFRDNFQVEEQAVQPKAHEELSVGSLQSVDDLEATFRRKRGEEYKGYIAAVSETCDPNNPLQLITYTEVAPNNVDDADLFVNALPQIQERMPLTKMYTDGGFGSPAADTACQQAQVEQIQSAIRGATSAADKFNLDDFEICQDEHWKPTHMTCPNGQTIEVEAGRTTGYIADFDPQCCQTCSFATAGRCRAKPSKHKPCFTLSFTQQDVNWARRQHRHQAEKAAKRNLRSAVEATVRSLKHPFPGSKLPVRGRFRTACLIIASAAMTNLRRIHRYRLELMQEEAKKTQENLIKTAQPTCQDSFLLPHWLLALFRWLPVQPAFSGLGY